MHRIGARTQLYTIHSEQALYSDVHICSVRLNIVWLLMIYKAEGGGPLDHGCSMHGSKEFDIE